MRFLKDILIKTGNTGFFQNQWRTFFWPSVSSNWKRDVIFYSAHDDLHWSKSAPGEQIQLFRWLISGLTTRGRLLLPRLLLGSPSSALEGRFVQTFLSRCSHVDTLLFHLRRSFLSSTPTSRSSRAFSSLLFELFWYLTDKNRELGLLLEINGSAVNYTIKSTYINKD